MRTQGYTRQLLHDAERRGADSTRRPLLQSFTDSVAKCSPRPFGNPEYLRRGFDHVSSDLDSAWYRGGPPRHMVGHSTLRLAGLFRCSTAAERDVIFRTTFFKSRQCPHESHQDRTELTCVVCSSPGAQSRSPGLKLYPSRLLYGSNLRQA